MTMSALKTHPKVYWIWNHRRWCLENIPSGPGEDTDTWKSTAWEKDMFVVEQMLEVDPRNCTSSLRLWLELNLIPGQVHAWDYRRYILANILKPRPPKAELTYTKQKIVANFSNFSAWHQRSKVLSSLWASGQLNELKSKENGQCMHFQQN